MKIEYAGYQIAEVTLEPDGRMMGFTEPHGFVFSGHTLDELMANFIAAVDEGDQ